MSCTCWSWRHRSHPKSQRSHWKALKSQALGFEQALQHSQWTSMVVAFWLRLTTIHLSVVSSTRGRESACAWYWSLAMGHLGTLRNSSCSSLRQMWWLARLVAGQLGHESWWCFRCCLTDHLYECNSGRHCSHLILYTWLNLIHPWKNERECSAHVYTVLSLRWDGLVSPPLAPYSHGHSSVYGKMLHLC